MTSEQIDEDETGSESDRERSPSLWIVGTLAYCGWCMVWGICHSLLVALRLVRSVLE
jgi:hypothetical protein